MNLKITRKILDAFCAGDRTVSDLIVTSNYERTKGFICKMVKSNDIAEELTQEVFILLWENRHKIKSPETFYAYLNTLARNTTFQHFRKSSKTTTIPLENHQYDDITPDVESDYMALELELEILKEISKMPRQRRIIFEMNKQQDKTPDEIAAELNISKKTVQNQIYSALNQLRDAITIITLILLVNL